MLAPLKERAWQESPSGASGTSGPATRQVETPAPGEEPGDLRRALRESRMRLRRSAWESTKQITALNNEVSRLSTLCASYRQQLVEPESGVAIIELARQLMQLSAENEALRSVAHRVWTQERTIQAAHEEYIRLAQERDALAHQLRLAKSRPHS